MGMWRVLEEGRDDYGRDFSMRESDEAERAYKEGCRHGYERAMRELQGGDMGERNRSYRTDSYDMGERMRRRSDGRFY